MPLPSSPTITPTGRGPFPTCHSHQRFFPPVLPSRILFRKDQRFHPVATLTRPKKLLMFVVVLHSDHPEPPTLIRPTVDAIQSTLASFPHVKSPSLLDLSLSETAQQSGTEALSKAHTEHSTYLAAAAASIAGVIFLAATAIYYRFVFQLQAERLPCTEMFGTWIFAVNAAVGMEFWARWAHRTLWHACLWNLHESHHRHRDGSFELNDVFAIIHAVPAIALLAYGFFREGLVPVFCFGAGLGITVYGMAYMFVHDGLVHSRFPVGPIANIPYLQKVAAAHQLHHEGLYNGVPYGLFFGPKELEEVGGLKELEDRVQETEKS